MHPNRLEEYLDQLERPLTALSPTARREWREEAHEHLQSLIAAHEELGSSPEEAVEAAVRQFGDAARIGRGLRSVARRRRRTTPADREALTMAVWNIGLAGVFGALMRQPGAFDHLMEVGIGLGIAYGLMGAILGRSQRALRPRSLALFTCWAGSSSAAAYLALLAIPGLQGREGIAAIIAASALSAAAALGGLFLGAWMGYRGVSASVGPGLTERTLPSTMD
jgi:hypothetical protein